MTAALEILLTLVQQMLPVMGLARFPMASSILEALLAAAPIIIKDAPHLIAPVRNIITALKMHSMPLSNTQMEALHKLEAELDAAFDAVVAADPELAP